MYQLQKPVIFTFTNLVYSTYANKYMPYWVFITPMKYYDGAFDVQDRHLIYMGKTFCHPNADGTAAETSVDLTYLLRDFAWSLTTKYDAENQRYIPYNFIEPQSNSVTLVPVERDTENLALFNCLVEVELGVGRTYDKPGDVTITQSKPWYVSADYKNPYDYAAYTVGDITDYNSTEFNFGKKIYPQYPYMNSDNLFVAANFAVGYLNYNQELFISRSIVGINKLVLHPAAAETWGNYSFSISLSKLLQYTDIRANGNIMLMSTYTGTSEEPVREPSCIIGKFVPACTSRFFVLWTMPDCSIQCQPIQAKPIINEDYKQTTITTVNDFSQVVKNEGEITYNMETGYVSKDMYDLFMTVPYSPVVWVFDTELDEAVPCICTSNSVETTNEKKRNLRFTLKSSTKNIR